MRTRALVVGVLAVSSVLFAAKLVRAQIQSETRQTADNAFTTAQWGQAIKNYRIVVREDPADARSWFRLGYSLHADGNYKDAIDAYRRAIDLKYLRLTAQFDVACAYAKLEEIDRAFLELEKALDMGYHSTAQMLQDPDLNALRGTPKFDQIVERARNPVLGFSEGRAFQLPTGRWSIENGPAGTMTSNSVSRGFARQIDLVVDGKRILNVVLMFSPTQRSWSVSGADREGALFRGAADVTSRTIRASGKRDEGGQTRFTVTLRDDSHADVSIEDHVASEWRIRHNYRLTLQ